MEYVLKRPDAERVERIYPKNNAPLSPINIFAGCLLYGRNPKQPPATAARGAAIATFPLTTHKKRSAIAEIPLTVAASPSRPSIRFMALVTKIIHANVAGIESQLKFKIVPPTIKG